MNIREARPIDRDALLEIWLRSVRATHTFLTEGDVQFYRPFVETALGSGELDVWVLCTDDGTAAGFMGLADDRIEALFLDPAYRRRGAGRRMVEHARARSAQLTLDVNEQNEGARRFYEACGFVVEGRSELDSTGRPFPLLHMRLAADR